MKKHLNRLLVAAVAIATLTFAACGDDNSNTPTNNGNVPVYETLAGTEWEGTYNTTDQGGNGYPVIIHWTVDFTANGGEVMFYLESQAFDPDPYNYSFTYTFDSQQNTGVLDDGYDNWPFTIDPYNRTMTVELIFATQHEQDGPVYEYGGLTVLHQVR